MVAAIDRANIQLVLGRAKQLKALRSLVMAQLYPTISGSNPPGNIPTAGDQALITLSNTFSRYAQTQQTAYETGSVSTTATSSTNLMERQVRNAIAQVLGRAPGSSPNSFVSALNDAFPTQTDGKVSFMPSRASVSLYSQTGYAPDMAGSISAGLVGQLSAEQATLYRQSSIVAADALKVLSGLQPFVPDAELDRVEALRSLVRSEIQALVDEFGRVDEPRPQRVETYLDQLSGANGHLDQFGERAFLDRRLAIAATIDDEAQIAGFELLKSYVRILKEIWNSYKPASKSTQFPLFSERLSRASVLLPVIAEGNRNFMAAMDSIGFSENERRSSATKFTVLQTPQFGTNGTGAPTGLATSRAGILVAQLPDITVNDFNEWIDRFASLEAPSVLSDSGQYGLEFVTNQADRLFWVLVPILAFTKTPLSLSLNGMPILAQVLTHERVSWALDDLVNQLKALADLAA